MIRLITITAVLAAPLAYYVLAEHESPAPASVNSTTQSETQPFAMVTAPPSSPASESDGDTEFILGIPVRKDRDCKVELNDYVTTAGEMFSAYSCTPNQPATAHIYANYDNETLANMAYSDAAAAALLGRRIIGADTGKSYQLLIRAAALDGGNVEHLAWLADQAFGVVEIDGRPQMQNLQRQYELAALANRLGDEPGKAQYLKELLIGNGIDQSQIDALNLRVETLHQTMQAIQRTVFGEITMGGQDDV